jgi:hypothetical protein
MTFDEIVADANMYSHSSAALSWALRGNLAQVKTQLAKLTDAQRDDLMAAASIVIAVAGGLS